MQPAPAETMAIDITVHLWLLLLDAPRQPHDLLLEVCARRAHFANPHVHPEAVVRPQRRHEPVHARGPSSGLSEAKPGKDAYR